MSNKDTKVLKRGENIVGYRVTNNKGEVFDIPVVDSRIDSGKADWMIKNQNAQKGSQFIKPSYSLMGHSYNVSRKKY